MTPVAMVRGQGPLIGRIAGIAGIILTCLLAIYSTIYSLTHGIYEVFPFLYFLPIIIFVYLYPSRVVIFVTIRVVTSSFAEVLRTEERKYRGIFENSQAGIFTFDLATLRIHEINVKCAHMLKFERDDLRDADLSRILAGSRERDRFVHEIRTRIQTG